MIILKKRKLFTGDDSRGFNLNRFNQIYQDNKLEDDNEDGYERWMVENQPEETTDNPRLFKKYNKRHFTIVLKKMKNKGLKLLNTKIKTYVYIKQIEICRIRWKT